MKPPRTDPAAVRAELEGRLAKMDRTVFVEPLAAVLAALRSKGHEELAGMPADRLALTAERLRRPLLNDRTEVLHGHLSLTELIPAMVSSFGKDEARTLIQAAGLPADLIPAGEPERAVIEHDPEGGADTPSGKP